MGLKCSVLGHKYGDATVERDREEQGSEVVITIREMETCDRCGTERIVSENKEVTSIATPDEPVDAGASGDADGSATTGPDDGTSDDGAGDDVFGEGEPGAAASGEATSTDGETDVADESGGVDDSPAPVESNEGAEILDAESDDPVTDDELADPSIEDPTASDDPVPADTDGEDAVIIGDDDETEHADGRAPGEWPEEPDDEEEEAWKPTDAIDDEQPIKAPDAGTDQNTAVSIPDGQFRCPECGYTTPVESSSLRAGDFCPDCHKGSLVHEPKDGTRKE